MKLGTMIRDKRKTTDVSLTALARRLRISPSHLSRIERNHAASPSRQLLNRIATTLQIGRDDLFLAAGRVPDDVAQWIVATPGALEKLRREMRAA